MLELFTRPTILRKGFLTVLVLAVFELAFLILLISVNNSIEESLTKERRAREIVTHIERIRNFVENAIVSAAQYKSSAFDDRDYARIEKAEQMVLREVVALKDAVRDNPKESECVTRMEYCALQARKISVEYLEQLQNGSLFTQSAVLLRMVKVARVLEPDIESLRAPYEEIEQRNYEEGEKKRKLFYQLLMLGIPLNIAVAIGILFGLFLPIVRRVNVIVDNIGRLERKESQLNPIVGKDPIEIHMIDARFHEMTDELAAAEKHAREVEQLKQEFVSMISHDLRSPLTSLQFTLSLLCDGTYGEINDKGLQRVNVAEKSVIRLIGLINDLLDLEKMESGMMNLQFDEFLIDELFDEAIAGVSGMAEERGIKLESVPLEMVVIGDVKRLSQVLVNLLSNAIKFSPDNSTVVLKAEDASREFLKISVIDRGRGIPKASQAAIFERFKQVKEADSQPKKGTGLGLAIAKSIVELHGGAIGVESVEGDGSTFWLSLPKTAKVPTSVS